MKRSRQLYRARLVSRCKRPEDLQGWGAETWLGNRYPPTTMFKSDSKGLESKAPTMSSVALLEASYALGKRGVTENVDNQIGELLMAAKTIDDQRKEEENPPPARFSRLQQAAIGVGTVAAVGLAALIAVAVRSMANSREDDDES